MARILIVETDKLLAENLRSFLRHAGHEVDWHHELQAAIDCADQRTPDLVLMDLMLCNRSGIEFLYEFRSYPDWQDLPVVIFSNVSVKDLGRTTAGFEQLKIAAYHHKPTTTLAQLAHTIDFIVKNPVRV